MFIDFINSLKITAHNILNEKKCIYCEKIYSENSKYYGLCSECADLINPRKKGYCSTCGNIFLDEDSLITENCEKCIENPPLWSQLKFFGIYDEMLQEIIIQAKFNDNLIYHYTLADIIREKVLEFPTFDYLIPIPIHQKRLLKRGYNQCLEIVKYINKKDKIPYSAEILKKIKHTEAQSNLHREQRIKNLDNAFWADLTLCKGKTFLLLDDVSTTGTTLHEATKTLLNAGAVKVYVVYIAGTPLADKKD